MRFIFIAVLATALAGCNGFRTECFDGIDNDQDGFIDAADPGCDNPNSPQVQQRANAQDQACGTGVATTGLPVDNPACQRANVGTRESDDPACFDGVDSDGDTLVDLADPGCADRFDSSEESLCSNGLDDDGDGLIDYELDPGCLGVPSADSEAADPACSDGRDNDGDGRIDFPQDLGCANAVDNNELGPACSDLVDNDADGFIDLEDPDCSTAVQNREAAAQCRDGIDNDFDGLLDFADANGARADLGCSSPFDDSEADDPACFDNIDNDGDGDTDFPNDAGCLAATDTSEAEGECADGIDNDSDGSIDYNGIDTNDDGIFDPQIGDVPPDPGCTDRNDPSELAPECNDGLDNDLDGNIDFPNDPGCLDLVDTVENTFQCSDQIDNDGDALIDFPFDPDCGSDQGATESDTGGDCNDKEDNDGDGFIDTTNDRNVGDPACDAFAMFEALDPVCGDRLDNDGDGLADLAGVDLNNDGFFDGVGEFAPDPGCFTALHHSEAPDSQCGDGIDNDGDGEADFGLDTDGDGIEDIPPDQACVGQPVNHNDEASIRQCEDGVDNDGDGFRDYEPQVLTTGLPNPSFLLGDPECTFLFHNDERCSPAAPAPCP